MPPGPWSQPWEPSVQGQMGSRCNAVLAVHTGRRIVSARHPQWNERRQDPIASVHGCTVGDAVGCDEGGPLGPTEGAALGDARTGDELGAPLGALEGVVLGARVGAADGEVLGATDGTPEGEAVGARVTTSHTCATCAVHPDVHTHPDLQSHLHWDCGNA
eukprot:gene56652-biopygen60474